MKKQYKQTLLKVETLMRETYLSHGLDKLPFHNFKHPLDVRDAALRLGKIENIDAESSFLLETAALSHDVGYTVRPEKNEPEAVGIIEDLLPPLGYSTEHLKILSSLILVTALPQKPTTLLETLICDADLDNLGRKDFFEWNEKLRQENQLFEEKHIKEKQKLKNWTAQTLAFMEEHRYFSKAACSLRNKGKEENIKLLKKQPP